MSVVPALFIDMILKGSLLCLAGFALAAAMRHGSASLRHDCWMAVLASCALLPLAAALWQLLDARLPVAPVHSAVMAVTANLPASAPSGALETVDRIWSGDGGSPALGWMGPLVIGLWALGFAVAVLRGIADYASAAAMVRRASPVAGAPLARRVQVRITPEIGAPALFGLRSPVILLPQEASAWPEERVRAVFAHKMAHVERRDCAIELLVQLAVALHWCNPLVRAAARRLRIERELACDERVVSAGLDPRGYASALVQIARTALGRPRLALLAMARPPELERRVLLLLGPMRTCAGPGRLRRAMAGGAVLLLLMASVLTAPASGVLAAGSVQPGSGPLGGLDDPMSERVPLDYERLAVAAAAVPADGPEAAAIAGLKADLGRQSRGYGDLVRERAIWSLSLVRDGRLFEAVAEHSADRDWRLRAYSAWALSATGDPRATPLLAAMLDDPVWRVRAMAAGALADLGDPGAARAMAGALDDPAWQVRMGVVEYVERVGDPALVRRLRPLLEDPHYGTRMRAEAVLHLF